MTINGAVCGMEGLGLRVVRGRGWGTWWWGRSEQELELGMGFSNLPNLASRCDGRHCHDNTGEPQTPQKSERNMQYMFCERGIEKGKELF